MASREDLLDLTDVNLEAGVLAVQNPTKALPGRSLARGRASDNLPGRRIGHRLRTSVRLSLCGFAAVSDPSVIEPAARPDIVLRVRRLINVLGNRDTLFSPTFDRLCERYRNNHGKQ